MKNLYVTLPSSFRLRMLCIAVFVFIFSDVYACSNTKKLALKYLLEDDYDALVAQVRAGDPLDAENKLIYQRYYKRALRMSIDELSDRVETAHQMGGGDYQAMNMMNILDDPEATPVEIVNNEKHPYHAYRQVSDTIRQGKYEEISINGYPLSTNTKKVIEKIDEATLLSNDPSYVYDYLDGKIPNNTALRILRNNTYITLPDAELPIMRLNELRKEFIKMEEGQNAIIQLHLEVDEPTSDLLQRTVAEPYLVHYHDGSYYFMSFSRFKLETAEINIFTKAYFTSLDEAVEGAPLQVTLNRFEDAVTDEYYRIMNRYNAEVDRLLQMPTPRAPAVEVMLDRYINILRRYGQKNFSELVNPADLSYSIFTRK